ncbi:MAG: hypothetical protein J6Y83_07790 [Bacteroidales bacterium]|nr:hypothetical protein [Bacteroidales bacterium]
MRFLRALCRLVFGLTFIFSGLVKLLSPVGTSLIFQEYFSALHLGFLSGTALYAGMLLAVAEFTVGMCILLSVRMKLMTGVGFYMCCFFTLLTLYLALFNPISDCGCFGEAVHLTNWQTFFKNLILLPCIALLYFQRKKIDPIAAPAVEWVFAGFFFVVGVCLWLHSYLYVPMYEFTPYKIGSHISDEDDDADFVTTFIYSKDGENRSFTLEDLPDSTWTYVETVTEMTGTAGQYSDFIIQDAYGNDITPNLLYSDDAVLISIYDPAKLKARQWERIEAFAQKVTAAGADLYIASSAAGQGIPDDFPLEVGYGDRKLLLTINRSNGGATLFSDGYLSQKWTQATMDGAEFEGLLSDDGETLVLRNAIHSNVRTSCLVLGILLVMILIYYICKISYKGSSLNKLKRNKQSRTLN